MNALACLPRHRIQEYLESKGYTPTHKEAAFPNGTSRLRHTDWGLPFWAPDSDYSVTSLELGRIVENLEKHRPRN